MTNCHSRPECGTGYGIRYRATPKTNPEHLSVDLCTDHVTGTADSSAKHAPRTDDTTAQETHPWLRLHGFQPSKRCASIAQIPLDEHDHWPPSRRDPPTCARAGQPLHRHHGTTPRDPADDSKPINGGSPGLHSSLWHRPPGQDRPSRNAT